METSVGKVKGKKWDFGAIVRRAEVPYTVRRVISEGSLVDAHWARGDAVELAEAMIRLVVALTGAPLVWDLGAFWLCDPGCVWRRFEQEAVASWFAAWAGSLVYAGHKDGAPILRPLKIQSLKPFGDALRTIVGGAAGTGPGFFDSAPLGVTFADCFVEVSKRELTYAPPSWEQRSRYGYDFELAGTGELKIPTWQRYCQDVWADEAETRSELLQEFVGAAIVGASTSLNRALFLAGVAGSGKSTFIKVLESLMPDGDSVSHVAIQDFSHEYKPSALIGSRLNTLRDAEGTPIFGEGAVRQVIGGEPMTINVKYGQPCTFRPQAAHVFGVNDLPQAPGVHEAFWRRFIVIDFTRQIRDTAHEDREIDAKLLAEREELVRWAIAGAARVLAQGDYTIPESCKVAASTWRQDADSVSYYLLTECQHLAPGSSVHDWCEVGKLHERYASWCDTARLKPVALITFSKRLRQIEGIEVAQHPSTRRAVVSVR